jgi:mRNA interferase MazF
VCILTSDAALSVLGSVTCAPITRTVRGIASEVPVGPEHGLPERAVVSCDTLITIPHDRIDAEAVGQLDPATRLQLDRALRYALGIPY